MRNFYKMLLTILWASAIGATAAMAAGSGAYRLEVPDAGAFGKGSAFVGEANTPASLYYNPAGMVQIVGQAVSVTASLVEPHATYKGSQSSDAVQMKRGDYLVPSFYYVTKLGTDKVALGIGATSSWGLATEWAGDSYAKYVATKTSMSNHDYLIALAYQLTAQWSVAAGLDIDQSKLIQEKKFNLGTAVNSNSRMVGSDTAASFRLAALYKLNDQHQFGIMYRSAVHHEYRGKAYMDGIDPAFVPAVFPATSYSTDVMVKTILPQSVVLGYSFKPADRWTINADLEWMNWSQVKQVAVAYTSETDPTRLSILNTGNPTNKDWHDTLSLAMGTEYAATEALRLRGGFFLHQSPVNKSTWDPSVPDSDSLGITMGAGYDITKNWTADLTLAEMFYKTRHVNNDVGSPSSSIDGKYHQHVNLVLAGATYKF
jgi:long-chain fatty acid transport protein